MYTGGYSGKILRINLTDKTSKEEKLDVLKDNNCFGHADKRKQRVRRKDSSSQKYVSKFL